MNIRDVRFVSSEQFLLGERIKVIQGAQKGLIGWVYSAYERRNTSILRQKDHLRVYLDTYGEVTRNVSDVDLDIIDEDTYVKIKTERLVSYDLHQKYLLMEEQLLKDKFRVKYKQIIDLFEEAYPETFDWTSEGGKLAIIVLFPHIDITNTEKSKHTIKELYIKLTFKENGSLEEMWGMRGTITKGEHDYHYGHSHMSAGSNTDIGSEFSWNTWCRGGSEFEEAYRSSRSSFNMPKFRRFVYQLPSYLAWESLEGGPHRKIREISHVSAQHPNVISIEQQPKVEAIYKELIKNITDFPITIVKGNNVKFNVASEAIEAILAPYAGEFTCNKVGMDYWLKANESTEKKWMDNSNKAWANKVLFKFKGQDVKPKAVMHIDENTAAISVPYPDLTAKITNKLKQNLNQYVISK